MKNIKLLIPYIIALLCAGFACTQDVFFVVIDWLGSLSLKLNYGWYTVLLIAVFTIWSCYQLKVNWRKCIYSSAFTVTLVFFVVTTLYYRFVYEGYDYVLIVWKVAYADVLWLLAVAFVVEAIVNKYTRRTIATDVEGAIILDSPIETPDEDKFDYYSEAKHIATTLSQLPKNKAVSVAVLSPWGNGKTSFVNLIKYAIKYGDNGNPLFENIIIEFNPRQSRNKSSIQEDFFKALIDAIPNESRIRNKISNYLENIGIQDLHPLAKLFTRVIRETKEDAVNEVNMALDCLGKRLIVFVDDFDRLTDEEIIEVLKLIDNNAAFRHTIFITAYDEGAVANALKKYESSMGIAYIDKFFTLRFHLPLRSEVSIVNAMYQILLKKVDKDIELLPIMNRRFRIIAECVRNLRDVKNFCNMFMMDYVFNSKYNINLEEYLLLELMKFRYYDDYCCLYKKDYIENGNLFQLHSADAIYTLKKMYSKDENGKDPNGEMPRSINILRSLFSDYRHNYGISIKKPLYPSVRYMRYFEMYFINRGYGHIQAERLELLYVMQNDESIENFYRQCIQDKTQGDIVDFLRYQDWQDISPKGPLTRPETFKQFVRLVFLYSAVTDDDDTNIHSLQLQLIYKSNFKEKGYNGLDEKVYHDYLISLIYDKDKIHLIPLAFLMNITHTLISPSNSEERDEGNFILKSGEVKQKNLELFKKYIATQKQYTPSLSSVYRLCIDRVENSHLIMMEEANDIMRDFLYKDDSNEYLKDFLVFNEDRLPDIFVSLKDPFFKQIFPVDKVKDLFKKYVEDSLQENDINRKELLEYLKRYRKAGSNHTGCYYMKKKNPIPSHMEIIEGLEF